jgi:cytoskeletal protein CcmA (bactofilin family)
MKKQNIKIMSAILFTALLLVVFPVTAFAASPEDVVIGNSYTLEGGQTLNNDLFVLGGNVNLMNGSTVIGNVIILGGTAQAAGTINGNLVVLGGSINLASTFILNGNLTTAGGSLSRAPGAQINGQIYTNENAPSFVFPNGIQIPVINSVFNPALKVVGYFVGLILWALIAMLVAMFLSTPLNRTSQTALSQPLLSGGLGLLTIVVVPIILILLAITICLSPIALLGAIILVVAWAYGLIALGSEVGKRISMAVKNEWHPAIAAGVGTLVLMAILNGLQTFVPCIGWIPIFLTGIVGLGAVLLTQFGRKPYGSNLSIPGGSSGEIIPPATGSEINPPVN